MARNTVRIVVEMVVDLQLLLRKNHPPAHIENVPPYDAGVQVRLTTVVDDFGPTPTHRSINRPVRVQSEQISDMPPAAALGFAAADSFPRVLDHFAARGNALTRVHTP